MTEVLLPYRLVLLHNLHGDEFEKVFIMRSGLLFFSLISLICVGCADENQPLDMPGDAILDSAVDALDRAIVEDSDQSDFDLGVDALLVFDAEVESDVESASDAILNDGMCDAWQSLSGGALRDALHRYVQEAYEPVTPNVNQGGMPDRYTTARQLMFTRVFRNTDGPGEATVACVYTNDETFAPSNRDPDNNAMNCEHVWPRARLASDRNSALYEHQQSDIHHLAPTRPEANSRRGSNRFGVVVRDVDNAHRPSKAGKDQYGDEVFEPQDAKKGDIARMLFYMSIRWGLDMSNREEDALREWHSFDRVDDEERARNDAIEMVQGNRNPFIDCPAVIGRLGDFDSFPIQDSAATLPFP